MNPYWGTSFFEFIVLFFNRMSQWVFGSLTLNELASDEVQVLALICIAFSGALVGCFLVLKRMTMLANSLSHTILLGIVGSYLLLFHSLNTFQLDIDLKILLIASLLTGLITTVLTQFLTQVFRLQEDASIGLVFTTLFALGIVLVTLFTRNMHIGTEVVMGNVDALHPNDLKMVFYIGLVNIGIIGLLFKEFKLISFDPALAKAIGFSPQFFSYLLMVLTAATAIAAFRAVGVLLFLAFITAPVLSARLLTDRLEKVIIYALLIGIGASFFGVALSRHILSSFQIPLSTAGLVVTLLGFLFVLSILIHLGKRRFFKTKLP